VVQPYKLLKLKRQSILKTESELELAGSETTDTVNRRLSCVGTNIRSLYAPENFYSLNKLMEDENPDIVFINETWHQEKDLKPLPNRNYSILHSQIDGSRGGGVAILHRNTLIITPLFAEFHCRNFLLARLSSRSSKPILLLCIYFPPDHPS